MSNNEVKQHNATISVFRTLAAFFVITQHVPYQGSLKIIYFFMPTAVPFFFLVAGYFSWNSNEKNRSIKIKKHMKKIAVIYCGAYLFYYLISVFLKYAVNGLFHKNIPIEFENWNLFELGKGLLLDIDPFASHLWFLYAMIFVYILLWIFHFDKMLYPGLLLSLLFFFVGKTQVIDMENFGTIKRAVTSDFSLVFLGYGIHAIEEKGLLKKKNYLLCALMGITLLYLAIQLYLNRIFVRNDYTEYIAMAAFFIAIKYKNIGEGTVLDKIGEKYTLGIYIFHIFVMHMWERVSGKIAEFSDSLFIELDVWMVYILSLLLVIILYNMSNQCKLKIAKRK